MIIFALILLTIGILSTGSTRHEVYRHDNAREGGRIACLAAIIVSYLLQIFWMMAFALTAILSFIYLLFNAICNSANNEFSTEKDCLNLSSLKALIRTDSKLILCEGEAQQFCAVSSTAVVWYLAGLMGSASVCLGLIQFMATSAANYAHLRHEWKKNELEEVLYAETGRNLPLYQFRSGSFGNLMDSPMNIPSQQPVRMRSTNQQTNQQMRYYQKQQPYSTNLRRTSYHASQNVDLNNVYNMY